MKRCDILKKILNEKKFKLNVNIVVFLGYFIFIILLGISYAYFNTTLRINGVASVDGYVWPEGILPTVPVKTENGTQFSTTFQSEYISGDNVSSSAQSRFQNVNETYDTATSTYTMTISKTYKFGQSWNTTTENFNLNYSILNYSNVTWTNGEVTNTAESNGSLLSNVSGTIDKTTLAPDDTATLNMKFTLKIYGSFAGTNYIDKITYKVNYLVDGEVKTITVIINFICA